MRIDIFLYFVSSVFQSILPTIEVKTVVFHSRARLASERRYQKLRFETNTFDWRCTLIFLFFKSAQFPVPTKTQSNRVGDTDRLMLVKM